MKAQQKHVQTVKLDDLGNRFLEYRDQALAFSRGIMRNFQLGHEPAKTAELNIRLTKTVFSKWSIEILVSLYTLKSAGFEELRKALGAISSRVLSQKLKVLEEKKLVHRTILPTRPPRSVYSLTEKGLTAASLGEPVILYLRWTEGLI